jgi:hypothetical protein
MALPVEENSFCSTPGFATREDWGLTMKHYSNIFAACGIAALVAAPATAGVGVTALSSVGYVQDSTDLFDVAQGSSFVGGSGGFSSFDSMDAIGKVTASSLEPGNFVFNDFQGPSETQFIEFKTAAAVTISGFNLYLAESAINGAYSRYFNSVKLLGSTDGLGYTDLGSITFAGPNYFDAYGSDLIRVTSTFGPASYQFFRLETTGPGFSGGRILELDAIAGTLGNAVPEPASWVMMVLGFGLMGGAMRKRQAQSVTCGFA